MPNTIEPREKTEKLSSEGSPRHKFIVELIQKVQSDDDAREIWKNKQIVASNQRLGVRKRTNKNQPYPGYAEVPIPVTDKIIKKLKSLFVSVATNSKKQIQVSLEPGVTQPQGARESSIRVERALNSLIRTRSFKWARKVGLFIDYFLENGHSVFKVIEKFEKRVRNKTLDLRDLPAEQVTQLKKAPKDALSQLLAQREGLDPSDEEDGDAIDKIIEEFRSGELNIPFSQTIVSSLPEVLPLKGINVIVPPSATELQRLPRITHDMWITWDELHTAAEEGIYNKSVVDSLKADQGTADDSLTATAWDLAEGISRKEGRSGSDLFNVRECQTIFEGKKWVFSWINELSGTNDDRDTSEIRNPKVLQEAPLPYDHGLYTYVKHDNEVKNQRWYSSRGVPEQIRGLHHVMEKMFNARVIRDEYNNNPMFRVSRQLGFSGDEIRMKPGQVIEAEQGEIEQINKAITTDISSERIEAQSKSYIEEYQSIIDFSAQRQGSQGEARTATEILALQGNAQQQINTEVSLFLESLSEVAHQMFMILKQSVSGPRIIGGVTLTPADFLPRMNVSWIGSVEASNHQLQVQKSLQRIDTLTKVALPAGIMTGENLYNALRDWLEKDPDVENIDDLITRPQEIQVDQSEDQMQEIMMMLGGFNPQVKPSDNHAVHLQVLEGYIQSDQGRQAMQANPAFAKAIEQHINIHLEAEKATKQGGNTDDPRRKRVLQTFTNENGRG